MKRVIERGTSVKARGVAAVYQDLHLAWRAGLISDFYYGQAGPDDLRTVWRVDALELEDSKDARKRVLAVVAENRAVNAITSIEHGPQWCGYRAVIVTYSDGRQAIERWNGHEVEVSPDIDLAPTPREEWVKLDSGWYKALAIVGA
jgi:hypothetical protein